MSTRAEIGTSVVHARYVPYSHAHYAGDLVDGAYSLALFGDVATELCIRTDGDEGLFASYSDVQFLAPVRAGDCLEASATLIRVGRRSREMAFEVRVTARGNPDRGESAADLLDPPIVATTARGVVVVPHGWGHATTGPRRARALPGVNVNDVVPGGPAHMDPVSGQAVMLAHEVEVTRVSVPTSAASPMSTSLTAKRTSAEQKRTSQHVVMSRAMP